MLNDLNTEELAKIGLVRGKTGLSISVPDDANIYAMTVGAQLAAGKGERLAMIFEQADGVTRWTFNQIDQAATALAAHLRGLGLGRGSLVALHTGNRPETAIAHMAICKLGGTAVTLSQLYGPDALSHALNHSEAKCLLTIEKAWAPLRDTATANFTHIEHVLVAGSAGPEADLTDILAGSAPVDFVPDLTGADDPALQTAALIGLADCRYRLDDEPAALQALITATQAPENELTWRAWKELAVMRVQENDIRGAARA